MQFSEKLVPDTVEAVRPKGYVGCLKGFSNDTNEQYFFQILKQNKTKQNETTVLTAYGLKGGFGARI